MKKPFDDLDDFVKITGAQADSFKDKFVYDVVARQENGFEKAADLKKSDDYAILLELHQGTLHFQVTTGSGGKSYVAFGPNIIQRYMNDTVAMLRLGSSTHGYANAYP